MSKQGRYSGVEERLRRVEPRQAGDFPGIRAFDHMDGLKPQTPVDPSDDERARGVFPISAGERRREED